MQLESIGRQTKFQGIKLLGTSLLIEPVFDSHSYVRHFSLCSDSLVCKYRPQFGMNALLLASWFGHLNILQILVSCGAKLNSENKVRAAIFHWSVKKSEFNRVSFFFIGLQCNLFITRLLSWPDILFILGRSEYAALCCSARTHQSIGVHLGAPRRHQSRWSWKGDGLLALQSNFVLTES